MTSEHDKHVRDAVSPRYGQPQCESNLECKVVLRSSLLDRVKLCSIGPSLRQESPVTRAACSSGYEFASYMWA